MLISGEAGIGKTSLITHFVQSQHISLRFLRGACDPFSTPHPLCPLIDIARQIPDEELSRMLWESSRPIIFHTCFEKTQSKPETSVVVFEDVHWADEATYDLLIYLGRRIQETNCLMIITYRNDELAFDHPVRSVIGRLSGQNVERIRLKPLSKQAVTTLAHKSQRSADNLYELTGGNPFYLTEFLANDSETLPHSVSEAIVARFMHQSSDVRKILEFAALIPKKTCNYWLLDSIWDVSLEILEKCATSGLVDMDANGILFRHALMRQAITESLPDMRRNMLHILAIQGLIKCHEQGIKVGFTHIVYHAQKVKDVANILKYAPMAAEEAINLGAHEQAAEHYRTMLAYHEKLDSVALAEVYDALAYECYLLALMEEAQHHTELALQIWRTQNNTAKEIVSLKSLSRYHWFLGNSALAEDYADRAIAIAEQQAVNVQLAMVYSNRAQLHMLKSENEQAIAYSMHALKIAEEYDSAEVITHALNNLGTAQWNSGNKIGLTSLQQSLSLALEHQLEEHVARAYTNITCLAVGNHNYELATEYFEAGLQYCEKQNLDSWDVYMRGWLARLYFEMGKWETSTNEAEQVLQKLDCPLAIKQPALLVASHIAIRQGSLQTAKLLETAWQAASEMNEVRRIIPTLAARAEAAWFNDELEDEVDLIRIYYEMTLQHEDSWQIGVLAFWLWRANRLDEIPDQGLTPYTQQIMGNWQAAAEMWAEIACPYEEAMALADGDEEAQKNALLIFEQLGAEPAVQWLHDKMRANGISGLPRKPRQDTLINPAGLTQQQMQVLKLLANGFSDAAVAECLTISPKTAGHHVSAILNKLDVHSRQEAAIYAIQQGWIILGVSENRD